MSGTLLSRLTGLLRDMVMAYAFGASAPLAAFLLAYRLIYLLRRLLGESLLHQGFIPHFEAYRLADPKQAARFFLDLFGTLTLLLLGLVLLGEGMLFLIDNEVARLMRCMLPGVVFLCLFGLTSGLLHVEKSYFIPSVSPSVFNGVWIVGVIAVAHQPIAVAISHLSHLITIACILQLAMTLPKVWIFLKRHLKGRELLSFCPFSKRLARLWGPLLLGVTGVAAVQINSAVDGVFARFAALEGPAYLWYAIRMQQLPLALFGLALSSALLPSLSQAFGKGDVKRFLALIESSVAKIFYLLIPCMVGIFVLGASGVNLLFGRGDFGAVATSQTTLCLWGYGLGLMPMALTQILAATYYAQKDYRTPALGFVFSALCNIAINALLVFGLSLGPASIALATSAAALVNVWYLYVKLHIPLRLPWTFLAVTGISGLATSAFGSIVLGDPTLPLILGSPQYPRELFSQCAQFGALTGLFFGLLAAFLWGGFGGSWRDIIQVVTGEAMYVPSRLNRTRSRGRRHG